MEITSLFKVCTSGMAIRGAHLWAMSSSSMCFKFFWHYRKLFFPPPAPAAPENKKSLSVSNEKNVDIFWIVNCGLRLPVRDLTRGSWERNASLGEEELIWPQPQCVEAWLIYMFAGSGTSTNRIAQQVIKTDGPTFHISNSVRRGGTPYSGCMARTRKEVEFGWSRLFGGVFVELCRKSGGCMLCGMDAVSCPSPVFKRYQWGVQTFTC